MDINDALKPLPPAKRYPALLDVGSIRTMIDDIDRAGGFVVGMTGVALPSSLISGILAHPRTFRDAFHLRLGGSPRLQEADLHNRIGVWGLPFHFIVALSGAFLGLLTIVVGVLGWPCSAGTPARFTSCSCLRNRRTILPQRR